MRNRPNCMDYRQPVDCMLWLHCKQDTTAGPNEGRLELLLHIVIIFSGRGLTQAELRASKPGIIIVLTPMAEQAGRAGVGVRQYMDGGLWDRGYKPALGIRRRAVRLHPSARRRRTILRFCFRGGRWQSGTAERVPMRTQIGAVRTLCETTMNHTALSVRVALSLLKRQHGCA